MKNNSTTGLLFLIGAGAGAVATYLLDPEHGDDRRSSLSDKTHDALDYATDLAGQTVSHVTDTSRYAGRKLSALASDATDSASKAGTQWLRQGTRQASHAGSTLRGLFGHEEPTTLERAAKLATPTILGSSTGAALVGLGLYYFLGSSNAAEHRRKLAEKVHFAARETGVMGRRTTSYLRDRLQGSQQNDRIHVQNEQIRLEPTSTVQPTLPLAAAEAGNPSSVGSAVESGEPTLTGESSFNTRKPRDGVRPVY